MRIQPDLLAALDGWISVHAVERSRPDAIRYALRDWLVGQGFARPAPDDSEGAN